MYLDTQIRSLNSATRAEEGARECPFRFPLRFTLDEMVGLDGGNGPGWTVTWPLLDGRLFTHVSTGLSDR